MSDASNELVLIPGEGAYANRGLADVKPMRVRRLEVWLPILIVACDQLSKAVVRAMVPQHTSITVIRGFMDFTHVRNTGAAFGFLNAAEFPLKTVVIAVIATAALIGVGMYAASLAHHQIVARTGLALIIGGAAGNLIDRIITGSVVDFVDVYWQAHHFWAFNVADSAITVGVAIMILDMLGLGQMYPRLFEVPAPWIGTITVYTYGVLLAAVYLLGLRFAMARAKARGLDSVRVLDLGIYIIISALVGAKLLLLITDFRTFRADPSELLTLARSGGVFYGGLILAVIVALWYIGRAGLPLWTTCDVFAPGIALGHVVGRFGCFFAGCCYGKPTSVPWAITFSDPFAAANVGTPLGVHLHPTQLYEAGAEFLILVALLMTERKGKPFAGRTFWLYILLYAISRFIIEFYRGDERGTVGMFSTSQFISIVLAPLAIGMLVYLSRAKTPEPKRARKAA